MMYCYDGLRTKLAEKGISRTSLTKSLGISSRTIAKIDRDKSCQVLS